MPSTLTLLKSATVFGRDATCDCRLDWDGCSRTHFTIHGQQPDGTGLPTVWLLVDDGNGTNNGVFVNGRRVARATLRSRGPARAMCYAPHLRARARTQARPHAHALPSSCDRQS